jgi:hypothetical protein
VLYINHPPIPGPKDFILSVMRFPLGEGSVQWTLFRWIGLAIGFYMMKGVMTVFADQLLTAESEQFLGGLISESSTG